MKSIFISDKSSREYFPFQVVDLFEDSLDIPSIDKLRTIQDAFFDMFEEPLLLCPMNIDKRIVCHFYVGTGRMTRERFGMYAGFVYGYLKD